LRYFVDVVSNDIDMGAFTLQQKLKQRIEATLPPARYVFHQVFVITNTFSRILKYAIPPPQTQTIGVKGTRKHFGFLTHYHLDLEYMKKFADDVCHTLAAAILQAFAENQQLVLSPTLAEVLFHSAFVHEKTTSFFGRAQAVSHISVSFSHALLLF
jgi:hypothetical protein